MGWFRFSFILIAFLAPSLEASLCPQWLASWRGTAARFLRPEIREWNRYRYEIARGQAERGALSLEQLDTPEKLFAFVDNTSLQRPFQSQIAAIESLGGKVAFKSFRIPIQLERQAGTWNWEWVPRAPDAVLRAQWRVYHGLPYRSREAISIITVANAPPRSAQELVEWTMALASQLTHHRLRLRASYSGLLSGPRSFSAGALDELERAESDQYAALQGLQAALPGVSLPLPKTDGVWRWRKLQTTLGIPLRVLIPSYNALAPYRANVEGMRAWEQGTLRAHLERKYQARLRWKWLFDRYRNFFLGTALVVVPTSVYEMGKDYLSGELWERLGEMQKDLEELPERYAAPRLNEDIRHYRETPGGDPIINEHYNSQIRELEATIAESGDTDGKLRKKIEKLVETREMLNH